MKIASWNINSIRARAENALAFLEKYQIDVLALQETKCKTEQFPVLAFEAAGYQVAAWGINQWNGVAIISRVGLSDVVTGFPDAPTFGEPAVLEPRAIFANCGGVEVGSLYIPNGREVTHPHYQYKLDWLAALKADAAAKLQQNPHLQLALLGDWNVAPEDTDVWDIKAFEGKTHVTKPERDAFAAFASEGFTEVSRKFQPEPHTYSYWDYTQLRFVKNEGMRIDFGYTSPALTERVIDTKIIREERKGKGVSDHAPLVIEIN